MARILGGHLRRICMVVGIVASFWGAAEQSAEAGEVITGVGPGGGPHVKVFDGVPATENASFLAYPPAVSNGVRVAAGDVNGDSVPDVITSLGPGTGSHVKAISGTDHATELHSFFAYDGFTGGVFVAAGDVDGDGRADIVTGADAGAAPHVKVFSGATGETLRSFVAYPLSSSPGVRVAAGDVNGDGHADIITALGEGTSPHVKVFDGVTLSELYSFLAYPAGFMGGAYVAAGDLDGDGFSDIITGAGAGGGTHVKVFDGATGLESNSFFAFAGVDAEIRVAAGDVNGDGRDDLITGLGPGAAQTAVRTFNLKDTFPQALHTFSPCGPSFTGGVYVAGVVVPEPVAASLIGIAFAALAATVRRRTR